MRTRRQLISLNAVNGRLFDMADSRPFVNIYTDGAARGNPDGPGGYGAVIVFTDSKGEKHEKRLSEGFSRTTNNRMELLGAICALEALTKPCRVCLCSDSQYLIKAFNEKWIDGWRKNNWKRSGNGAVKNKDLWIRLLKALEPHETEFVWVKGHAGHEYNEICDKLATEAADNAISLGRPENLE